MFLFFFLFFFEKPIQRLSNLGANIVQNLGILSRVSSKNKFESKFKGLFAKFTREKLNFLRGNY